MGEEGDGLLELAGVWGCWGEIFDVIRKSCEEREGGEFGNGAKPQASMMIATSIFEAERSWWMCHTKFMWMS
jgi:hypothetical protein